jgi:hypothetical protein
MLDCLARHATPLGCSGKIPAKPSRFRGRREKFSHYSPCGTTRDSHRILSKTVMRLIECVWPFIAKEKFDRIFYSGFLNALAFG